MKRNISTGIYEIILNIPKGIHQFKFIVDNQWVCSKYYKIINDSHNNINNIIDTSNIPSQIIDKNDNNNSRKKKSILIIIVISQIQMKLMWKRQEYLCILCLVLI